MCNRTYSRWLVHEEQGLRNNVPLRVESVLAAPFKPGVIGNR